VLEKPKNHAHVQSEELEMLIAGDPVELPRGATSYLPSCTSAILVVSNYAPLAA
jgi:hypothetical protein